MTPVGTSHHPPPRRADFWGIRGHYSEARHRLKVALDSDAAPTEPRAKALIAAADAAMAAGEIQASRRSAEGALAIFEAVDNPRGVAQSRFFLADAAANEGDWETGRALFEESVRAFRALGDEHQTLWASRMLGWMYTELGDTERSRPLHAGNLARARAIGNSHVEAQSLDALASLAADEGRREEAVSLLQDSFRIWDGLEDVFRTGVTLVRLAAAVAEHSPSDAVRLIASAQRPLENSGAKPPWVGRMEERALATVRRLLRDDHFDAAWAEGKRLKPHDVFDVVVRSTQAIEP